MAPPVKATLSRISLSRARARCNNGNMDMSIFGSGETNRRTAQLSSDVFVLGQLFFAFAAIYRCCLGSVGISYEMLHPLKFSAERAL